MYGEGCSKEGELVDLAADAGIIEKSGAWYAYKGEKLAQGKENVKMLLKENTKLRDEIEQKIREFYCISIKNKKGKIIFGSTLATTIIAAGITGLIFIKGGNKARSTKKLSELAEKLAKDIQEASANQTDDLMTKCTVVCKKG